MRVSPPFFCRCMQASFSVLELVSGLETKSSWEIDVLKLSPFGARPHRKSFCRFIFQSLLQHVFSMGSYDGTTGMAFDGFKLLWKNVPRRCHELVCNILVR